LSARPQQTIPFNLSFINQKINDVDFINYVNKLDIVGFVETLVSDSPGNLLEYSLPFTVRPSRRKRRGRSSGGIVVYCKPHIQKGVKKVLTSNFCLKLSFMSSF
jgi:hypothetical protein